MSKTTTARIEDVTTHEITVEKKPYTFRQLSSVDVFLMFKIISKIGLKEFNACFENEGIQNLVMAAANEKAENGERQSASVAYITVILELADVLLTNIPKCETEIYQMLSQTSDLSLDEVKQLDMVTFAEMIIDFIKKEEFRDFIKVVSKLFK